MSAICEEAELSLPVCACVCSFLLACLPPCEHCMHCLSKCACCLKQSSEHGSGSGLGSLLLLCAPLPAICLCQKYLLCAEWGMKSIQVLFLPSCSVLKAAKIVLIPARAARIVKCNNWPPVTFTRWPSGLWRPTGVHRERERMAETFPAVSISNWRDERGNCSSYGAIKDTRHAPVGKCARDGPLAPLWIWGREKTKTTTRKKTITDIRTDVLAALLSVVSLAQLDSWCSLSALPGDKINSAVRSRRLKLCRSRDLEKCHFMFFAHLPHSDKETNADIWRLSTLITPQSHTAERGSVAASWRSEAIFRAPLLDWLQPLCCVRLSPSAKAFSPLCCRINFLPTATKTARTKGVQLAWSRCDVPGGCARVLHGSGEANCWVH